MAASDAVDHYAVLGVSESAPATEIRRAYLGLARAHHPDFHEAGDEAARSANEREMQRINQAWTILGDPTRRRGYDERRRAAQPGTDSRPRPEPARYDFVPYDDEDIDTDYSALIDDAVEGTEVPRWMQLLPVALLLGGIALFILGVMINLSPLLSLGLVSAVLGVLGFLASPAIAISRSRSHESRR
jgi:curved DNA-binding protein CbpA